MKRYKENVEEKYRNQLIAIQGDRENLRKYRQSQAKLILNVTLIYIPFIMILSIFFSGFIFEKYISTLKVLSIIFILPVYVGLIIEYISPVLEGIGLYIGIAYLIMICAFNQILPNMICLSAFISLLITTIFSQWYSKNHREDKMKEIINKISDLQSKY